MTENRVRLFVLGNATKARIREEAERLMPVLQEWFTIVACDLDQAGDLSGLDADLAVVLGGDGAILRAVHQMGGRQVPMVGINLGTLGFLAGLSPDEFHHCLPLLAARQFAVAHHVMFECRVVRARPPGGQPPTDDGPIHGANDLVIQAGPPFRMIEINLTIDGEPVAAYNGDGLILATPVGSTAHNLGAGGPILRPEILAFVITAICPHTLGHRSLVDDADKVYELVLTSADDPASLIVDGQISRPLGCADRVLVRRAAVTFQLVKLPGRSYYQALRDKLHWGSRPRSAGCGP